jgi:hypothetical protein
MVVQDSVIRTLVLFGLQLLRTSVRFGLWSFGLQGFGLRAIGRQLVNLKNLRPPRVGALTLHPPTFHPL